MNQPKNVVTAPETVIEMLQKAKKWKFNIDRNYTTGRIREVTAEQIKG